ncbi:hypothetical protein GCM10017688_06570 [Streptomyces ramulosus]
MSSGSTDSPASLYGPASLSLGVVAFLATVLSGYLGIAVPLLAGCLAVTFGVLGLVNGTNRGKCVIGLVGGAVGFLYPVYLMIALSM